MHFFAAKPPELKMLGQIVEIVKNSPDLISTFNKVVENAKGVITGSTSVSTSLKTKSNDSNNIITESSTKKFSGGWKILSSIGRLSPRNKNNRVVVASS